MADTSSFISTSSSTKHNNNTTTALILDRTKAHLPCGGEWFSTQRHMITQLQHVHGGKGFTVAWDTGLDGQKAYGIYLSPTDFYQCLLQNAADQRWGYELIPQDIPCKGYMDIEWIGPEDQEHNRLQVVVKALREKIYSEFSITPEIYVNCGTRSIAAASAMSSTATTITTATTTSINPKKYEANEHKDLFKHSYHVVINNLIFENNHNGVMKSFFLSLVVPAEDNSSKSSNSSSAASASADQGKDECCWFYQHQPTTKNNKNSSKKKTHDNNNNNNDKDEDASPSLQKHQKTKKCIIDGGVYTRNRVFRLPLCCKKSGSPQVPLVRINGNPTQDDFTTKHFMDDEDKIIEDLLPFIISNPELPIITTPHTHTNSNKIITAAATSTTALFTQAKRARVTTAMPAAASAASAVDDAIVASSTITMKKKERDEPLPFPPILLQRLLISSGDNVSVISQTKYIEAADEWQVQCDQKKQRRICWVATPVCQQRFHDSNNCILFVKKNIESGCFSVKIHCTAAECCKNTHCMLGTVFFTRDLKWKATLASSFKGHINKKAGAITTAVTSTIATATNTAKIASQEELHHNICMDSSSQTTTMTMLPIMMEIEEESSFSNNKLESLHDESNNNIDTFTATSITTTTVSDKKKSKGGDQMEEEFISDNDDTNDHDMPDQQHTHKDNAAEEDNNNNNNDNMMMIDPEDPESNTYELVKNRFELSCFKVSSPFVYAKLVPGKNEPDLFNPVQLKHYFANKYFYECDENCAWKKCLFIPRWVGDVHIREVAEIVIDPLNINSANVYNMWSGFAAEKLQSVVFSQVDTAAIIGPIRRHINEVITIGNQHHTEWLLDYLANIIQRPHQKSQVAISLYGKQGCGKGILFDFFRTKVLGNACSFQTANPENDLMGRFSNGFVNRVFIQIDEVKSMHEFGDKLKNMITNGTLNYEKKGKDTIIVNNLTNLIFTSNNENALAVSTDDRRFVLFRCSNAHRGDASYFEALAAHLEQPHVARGFYQFLQARDLSAYPYDFQATRPITEYYIESQMSSIPVISRFFSAITNYACAESISAASLYRKYAEFHALGNYKFLHTENAFGRDVKRIAGVDKRRTSSGMVYKLDFEKIKQHLIDTNEYDADSSLN